MDRIAVIFDLDGTLWDATELCAVAWNDCLRQRGIARRFTRAQCRSCCGKTVEQIADENFPDLDPEARVELMRACCMAENAPLAQYGGQLFPDLLQTLRSLRERFFLAVVSNCQEGYIEAFFTGNDTGALFDDYESAGRTGLSKGANIRLVMARNGIARAVYVGDTEGDRQAAEEASVPFIHAAYGFGAVRSCAAAIQTPAELPAALERVF